MSDKILKLFNDEGLCNDLRIEYKKLECFLWLKASGQIINNYIINKGIRIL
jgi:hypothetical protein